MSPSCTRIVVTRPPLRNPTFATVCAASVPFVSTLEMMVSAIRTRQATETWLIAIPTTKYDADGHCMPFCSLTVGLAQWFGNAAARDGGVKPAAKNAAIGVVKGAGQVAVALAAGIADKVAPGSFANVATSKAAAATMPSNQTQAETAPVGQMIATTAITAGLTAGVSALSGAATVESQVLTEGTIFRSGGTNPANLTGEDLSFRNALSNPIESAENPVFAPGDKYFGADVSKLPKGSAVLDDTPEGHVTVNASPADIKGAIVEKGKLPK